MRLSPATRFAGPIGLRKAAALAATTLLALAPALQAGPPPQGKTGTITGKLIWAAGPVPAPKVEANAANAKDPVCKAKPIFNREIVVDPATKGVVDAYAYLVKPTGDFTAAEKALLEKTPEVVVDQVNCEYTPYATVVHKDQKLIFKSSDPVGHNVDFKPFNNTQINVMLPPNGKMTYTIKKEERRPASAICSIHPWMKGYVFIVDNPFAVVTQPDGSFSISGVPAGKQQLVVWQGAKGYVTEGGNKGMTVDVPAAGVADVGEIKITK
jgi:hypothetical protein